MDVTNSVLYSCNCVIGKKWGLQTSMIHWIFCIMVLPILSYGALVCWTATRRKSVIKKTNISAKNCLSKHHRFVRSTPTAALETILNLIQMDLKIKDIAGRKTASLYSWHLHPYAICGFCSSMCRKWVLLINEFFDEAKEIICKPCHMCLHVGYVVQWSPCRCVLYPL
uniref:Uncharacterized protein n=1 Tax=Megaselia scalaris TaxID=36166 RepID=T1GAI8_MEGSC